MKTVKYRIDEDKAMVYMDFYSRLKEYKCTVVADLIDFLSIQQKRNWNAHPRWSGGKPYWAVQSNDRVHLGRWLLKPPLNKQVDHKDRDSLNHRRNNLRLATYGQNAMNSYGAGGSSKFKGVNWKKSAKKWRAVIGINGRKRHLGYFESEKEAAKTYDKAATELFGEFALTNKELDLY